VELSTTCPCRTAAKFAGPSNQKRGFDSPQGYQLLRGPKRLGYLGEACAPQVRFLRSGAGQAGSNPAVPGAALVRHLFGSGEPERLGYLTCHVNNDPNRRTRSSVSFRGPKQLGYRRSDGPLTGVNGTTVVGPLIAGERLLSQGTPRPHSFAFPASRSGWVIVKQRCPMPSCTTRSPVSGSAGRSNSVIATDESALADGGRKPASEGHNSPALLPFRRAGADGLPLNK
jgi:hypothetical protein